MESPAAVGTMATCVSSDVAATASPFVTAASAAGLTKPTSPENVSAAAELASVAGDLNMPVAPKLSPAAVCDKELGERNPGWRGKRVSRGRVRERQMSGKGSGGGEGVAGRRRVQRAIDRRVAV